MRINVNHFNKSRQYSELLGRKYSCNNVKYAFDPDMIHFINYIL